MTHTIPETIEQQTAETVGITDLDQFVFLLANWHKNRVAQMKHLMEIPEDTLVVDEDSPDPIPLTGDIRKGFLMGIITGLSILGELPFVIENDSQVAADA